MFKKNKKEKQDYLKESKQKIVKSKRKNPFKILLKEIKLIKWVSFKNWIKYSFIVIGIATVFALVLTGFDQISQLVISLINSGFELTGLGKYFGVRTGLQIMIFICSLTICILCFLQSNKKDGDILKGLTSGTTLFDKPKDIGQEKTLTRIISVLIALVFILTIFETKM